MKRFFGSNKKEPPPSLQDAAGKVDARVEGLDAKIGKLEKELVGYREQVSNIAPSFLLTSVRCIFLYCVS